MRLVILESPFAGDVECNLTYARHCVRDALSRGEAPIASHLLYTQPGILDDGVHIQRLLGIEAGHAWIRVAQAMVVYCDLGISDGMRKGIARANTWSIPINYRYIKEKNEIARSWVC